MTIASWLKLLLLEEEMLCYIIPIQATHFLPLVELASIRVCTYIQPKLAHVTSYTICMQWYLNENGGVNCTVDLSLI